MITKHSKGRQTGYLMVDNRHSGGFLLEADTKRCAHCPAIVVLNPDRTRPRNHCKSCDSYICDNPGCHFECVPLQKVFDDALEASAKGQTPVIPKRFIS
jgi:hypothetical protein